MAEHEPSTDTKRRIRSALTRNTGFVLPIGVACGLILVLCGWAYGKIEKHDQTSLHVEHLTEKCLSNTQTTAVHAEQISEAKSERVYMRAVLEAMHRDIQEIKEAVKGR